MCAILLCFNTSAFKTKSAGHDATRKESLTKRSQNLTVTRPEHIFFLLSFFSFRQEKKKDEKEFSFRQLPHTLTTLKS